MKKLTLTVFGAMTACAAGAATTYVSPAGDDAAAGTAGAPKRTIQLVLNNWKSGDELVLLPGTYNLQTQKTESSEMASERGALHLNGKGVIRSSTGKPADVVIDGDGATECARFSGALRVSGITFQNGGPGTADTYGSNLSVQGADVLVSNCVIRGTAPTSTLPAAGLIANARITHCTFQDLKGAPSDTTKRRTSALYLASSNVVESCQFVDCVMTNVTEQDELAALVNGSAGSTIRNCTFLRSAARPLVLRGDAVVEGCSFLSNRVTRSGGAIYAYSDAGGAVVTNCVFDGNAATNYGGAIAYATSKANPVRITDCVFTDNTAGQAGGAISVGYPYATDAYLYLDNSVFTNNAALTTTGSPRYQGGGAIHFRGHIDNNDVNATCGGEIVRCEFIGNRANGTDGYGGALCMRMMPGTSYAPETILVRNCLFAKNACAKQGGAFYVINDSSVNYLVDSCTFVGNTALNASSGPAIYSARSGLCLTNAVFASNLVYVNTSNASYDYSSKCANSCFDPDQTSMTNAKDCVFADPKFVDQASGNYRLASKSSPCFDTGVALDWMANAVDLDGSKRLFGAKPDMGCYEFSWPLGFLLILR